MIKKTLCVALLIVFALAANLPLTSTLAQSDPTGIWQEASAVMENPRSEMPGVTLDGKIYVPGGLDNRIFSTPDLEAYDPATDTWQTLSPMPEFRHHHMAAAFEGKLYVFGGYETSFNTVRDTVFVYDPAEDAWQELDPMPAPMAAGTALVIEDAIYLVPGIGLSHTMPLWRFDPAAHSWETLATPAEVRDHSAAVFLDGKIYLLGGRNFEAGDLASIEIYDLESDTWSAGTPMNQARAGFRAAVIDEKIYVTGGELLTGTSEALDSMEIYDPETDTWTDGSSLPRGLHGHPMVVLDGVLYILGGSNIAGSIGNEGRVYIYQP